MKKSDAEIEALAKESFRQIERYVRVLIDYEDYWSGFEDGYRHSEISEAEAEARGYQKAIDRLKMAGRYTEAPITWAAFLESYLVESLK